jgi:predicted TIM-barrel fold metal-dependent hydrolase
MANQQIISADSHIETPPDEWARGIPKKFEGLAPRRITMPNGGDGFLVEGGIYQGGSNLFAGVDPKDYNPMGLKWNEMAGTGDGNQRLEELDADSIESEWLYPGVGGVRNITKGIKDDEGYHALIRTYNRWLTEDFCSANPDRLVGIGAIPDRGLEGAMAELEHCSKAGLKLVEIATFPSGKSYPSEEDDKFWAKAQELGMQVTVHTSMRAGEPVFKYPTLPPSHLRPPDYVSRLARYGIRGALSIVQFVMSGLFDRFPKLNIYYAENQIGWVPIYLEQMDHNYKRHHYWAETTYGMKPLKQLPSEYIKQHIYWGFFDDPVGIKLRHEIGVDRIMWGGDFPHVESDWPNSIATLDRNFKDVPADERHLMQAGNAERFLNMG